MKQLETFKEVVRILHTDYAGCNDKKGWDDPERIIKQLEKGEKSEDDFLSLIEDYLEDFKDNHVFIHCKKEPPRYLPFRVRRYKDALYVTHSEVDAFSVGSRMTHLDERSIEELAKEHQKLLDPVIERQRWSSLILKATTLTVNGHTTSVPIQSTAPSFSIAHEMKWIDSDTFFIVLPDFLEDEPLHSLLEKHQEDIERAENILIDIRHNAGGSDSVYSPLLPYLVPHDVRSSELLPMVEDMLMLLTERNCTQRIQLFEKQLQEETLSKETRAQLEKFLKIYREHFAEGFISTQHFFKTDATNEVAIKSLGFHKNVYVLTDWNCGSSGESFALTLSAFDNVTTVGRNTHGTWDYSNLTSVEFEAFTLYYGTSKMVYKEGFDSIEQIGFTPDIHLSWTPEMLERDIDREYVMNCIQEK